MTYSKPGRNPIGNRSITLPGPQAMGLSPGLTGGSLIPSWVLPGAAIDLDFANGRYFGGSLATLLSITRASNATDLLPSSASGYAYNSFGSNILTISPTFGLLPYEARTNLLLNSTAPATQTTGSLGTGTYTLWCNGSGSVTPSGGTATITGAAAATNGAPNTFTVTVAGTVVCTVAGSLNAFQLESGAFGTPFIVTAGATATKANDSITAVGNLLTNLKAAIGSLTVVTNAAGSNLATNPRIVGTLGSVNTWLNFQSGGVLTFNGTNFINTAAVTASGLIKSGVSWSGAGRSIVANNGTVVTDANVMGNGGTPQIGGGNSGSFLDGIVQRITVWNSRLPDATLKALTV